MVSEVGHRGFVEGASGSVGAEAVAEHELSDKHETIGEDKSNMLTIDKIQMLELKARLT